MASPVDPHPTAFRHLPRLAGFAAVAAGLVALASAARESGVLAILSPSIAAMAPLTALALVQGGITVLLLQRLWGLSSRRLTFMGIAAGLGAVSCGLILTRHWIWGLVLMAVTGAGWAYANYLHHRQSRVRRTAEFARLKKRAEEAQLHLAAVVDSCEEAVIGVSLEGAIFNWNRGAGRMYGYTLGDVLGRPLAMLVPPEGLGEVHEILKRVGRGERIDRLETIRVRKDGERFRELLTVAPLRDSTGMIMGASLVASTGERAVPPAVRESAPDPRLGTILVCSDDAILDETLDATIASWNPAAQRMFGYTAEEAIGQPIGILVPSERGAEIPEILKHIKKGNRVDHYETVRVRKDGGLVQITLTVSPLRDGSGNVTGAQSIARDITERKSMEAALLGRGTQLEAVDKELEAFTYAVSNDIRAPLRSIDGFTQIFLEDYGTSLDDRAREYLQRIRASCRRMTSLVENMFSLVRVSRREIRRERVDLSALARRVAEDLQRALPDRTFEFAIEDGAVAEGDDGLLMIALENLMNNACKSSGKRPKSRIAFGMAHNGGMPVYFVRDEAAIAADGDIPDLSAAFGPDVSDEALEGEAVGLATVRRIIHRHGGRIWADGRAAGGATVYFTL